MTLRIVLAGIAYALFVWAAPWLLVAVMGGQ